jgi:toxin secretion/phage lysis holin
VIELKLGILSFLGVVGSIIISFLGGWDMALQTLIIFMAADWITGLIVAFVFKKSNKTDSGGANSSVGFIGLVKKCMILLLVLIAYRLDLIVGSAFIRDGVIIAYIANEILSIIENFGLMGLPIPDVISKGIDMLKSKNDKDGGGLDA